MSRWSCPSTGQFLQGKCNLKAYSVNRHGICVGNYGRALSVPNVRIYGLIKCGARYIGTTGIYRLESYGLREHSCGIYRSTVKLRRTIFNGRQRSKEECNYDKLTAVTAPLSITSKLDTCRPSNSTEGTKPTSRQDAGSTNPTQNPHQGPRWGPAYPFSATAYSSLSKMKLSAFVVLTSMAGYAMAPGLLGPIELFYTALGTGLCALSANSFNQWAEVPFDSQMSRTRMRPLTRHIISQFHAFFFALVIGVLGVLILALTVNYGIALLGLFNIILYAAVYTPLKRISIANTWVGSVVGAIPPIMGWGATGDFTSIGPYIIAGILFSWQFPHFCSLSWLYRADYAKTGYKMMSVLDPKLNARVSLRHSLIIFALIAASYFCNLTTYLFLLDGGLVNLLMTAKAYLFWRNRTSRTAKSLFFMSLIHLPIIMILMMIHKIPL